MENIERRSFIKKSSLISFASLAGFLPFLPYNKKKKKSMFVHHVYFWLKNEGSAEDRKKLLEGLKTLKAIDVIRTFHIGKPANTNREVIDTSYAFSLLMIFDSAEDEATYQVHPIHKKFIENHAHLWSKVIVYDSIDA